MKQSNSFLDILPHLIDHLIALNELTADRVLTEIQNSIGTKVKTVQLQLKKEAKNKLKSMIKELDKLNNELENTDDQNTRDRMLERELKKTLEKVSAGKTPGIDGIEKEYLTRFWRLHR